MKKRRFFIWLWACVKALVQRHLAEQGIWQKGKVSAGQGIWQSKGLGKRARSRQGKAFAEQGIGQKGKVSAGPRPQPIMNPASDLGLLLSRWLSIPKLRFAPSPRQFKAGRFKLFGPRPVTGFRFRGRGRGFPASYRGKCWFGREGRRGSVFALCRRHQHPLQCIQIKILWLLSGNVL